jgi:hypothetical protein
VALAIAELLGRESAYNAADLMPTKLLSRCARHESNRWETAKAKAQWNKLDAPHWRSPPYLVF